MKWITLLTVTALLFIIAISFNCSIGNVMNTEELNNEPSFLQMEEEINIIRSILIKEYELPEPLIEYCDNKTKIGMAAYIRKQQGDTLDDVLQTIKDSKESIIKKGGKVYPPLYVESLRMSKTVYRHPEYTHNDAFHRFYLECIELRF